MTILVDGLPIDEDAGPRLEWSIGHAWERPAPESVAAGSSFVCSDDLTEQVSAGVPASAGVAASGWMRRLPTGLGSGRAALAGTPPRVYAESLALSGYTIGNITMSALFTWDGTAPAGYGISEIALLGDRDNELRGLHLVYVTNGGNVDLAVYSGALTVLLPSVNLLPGAAGLHALTVAPVNASGHKLRFSYDGSAVADVAMTSPYVTPSSSDSIGFGSRPDGIIYLNGRIVDLCIWNSLLSGADILALSTLPATPTYELPESASTGAAAVRVQASRFDPKLPTMLPARGVSGSFTVASGVSKINL